MAWSGVAWRGNRTDSPYERKGRRQEFVMVSPEETHEDEYFPLVGKAVDLRCVKVHLDQGAADSLPGLQGVGVAPVDVTLVMAVTIGGITVEVVAMLDSINQQIYLLSMGSRTPKLFRYSGRSKPRTTDIRVPRRR